MGTYRGSTIKPSHEKYVVDANKIIFVKGAYNLGPVYEWKQLKAGNTPTPGMAVSHDSGSAGEDDYITGVDKGPAWYGLAEFDPKQIADCETAYVAGDEIPCLPFHLDPGAICQGVAIEDPTTNIEADDGLCSSSGTSGLFDQVVEMTMANSSAAGKGCFPNKTWGTEGANGTYHYSRIYMRAAYYLTDPGAADFIVAYITGTGA